MALREDQKALAGLIRRGLSGDVKMTTPECPGPDELAAYYEKSLPSEEAARWETHFSNCAHCRMQLAAIARADESVGQPEPKPWPWGLIWNWRWLAPAAAALAVLLVWFALCPTRSILQEPGKGRTEVAMNAPPAASAPPSPSPEKSVPTGHSAATSPPAEPPEGIAGATKSAPAREFVKKPPAAPQQGIPQSVPKPALVLPPAPAPPPEAKTELTEKAKEESSPAAAMDQTVEVTSAPATYAQNARGVVGGAAQASKQEAASDAKKSRAAGALVTNARRATPAQLTIGLRSGEVVVSDAERTGLWRIGRAGSIERSDDAGRIWQKQISGISEDLLAGSAPSAKTCWVVGRSGVVLRTTDGRNWQQLKSPTDADLVGVEAQDAQQATVKTPDGRNFVTADGGKTWQPKE